MRALLMVLCLVTPCPLKGFRVKQKQPKLEVQPLVTKCLEGEIETVDQWAQNKCDELLAFYKEHQDDAALLQAVFEDHTVNYETLDDFLRFLSNVKSSLTDPAGLPKLLAAWRLPFASIVAKSDKEEEAFTILVNSGEEMEKLSEDPSIVNRMRLSFMRGMFDAGAWKTNYGSKTKASNLLVVLDARGVQRAGLFFEVLIPHGGANPDSLKIHLAGIGRDESKKRSWAHAFQDSQTTAFRILQRLQQVHHRPSCVGNE